MQRTFRIRKYHRTGAIAGVVFFGGMTLACLMAAPFVARPLGLIAIAVFPLAFTAAAVYSVFAAYRGCLSLSDDRVSQQGVWTHRELVIDHSVHAQWRSLQTSGSVAICSPLARITIAFDQHERDERPSIIRHLRTTVRLDQQTGWPEFCQRVALPLVEPPRDDPEIVLLKRAHIDRLFAWMLLPNMAITAALIHFGGWEHWPSLFALVPFWIVMRFLIPAGGARSQTWQTLPGAKWWLVSFGGLVSGSFARPVSLWLAVTIWGLTAIAFVQFFRRVQAEDRRRREHWERHADTADARWRAASSENPSGAIG